MKPSAQTLRIKKIDDISLDNGCKEGLSPIEKLAGLEWHRVEQCPWESRFPYKPEVRFQIGHGDSNIYLHYEVKEEYVKGQHIRPNENVWEDSCVEFFISLDGKRTYYNIEFNVLGAGLIGYGTEDKSTRYRMEAEVIDRVNTFSQVLKVNGKKVWRIILILPKDIFGNGVTAGQVAYANFYKCGDSLPQPHFLAWNNIENPTPNFHLPQYFGEVVFES